MKIDCDLSQNDNLSLRVSLGTYDTETDRDDLPAGPGGSPQSDAQSLAFNWSRRLRPHRGQRAARRLQPVILDDQPGGQRLRRHYNATLGIPGGQRHSRPELHRLRQRGIDTIGTDAIRHFTDNKTFQINEKLSLSRGRHYSSMGGQ